MCPLRRYVTLKESRSPNKRLSHELRILRSTEFPYRHFGNVRVGDHLLGMYHPSDSKADRQETIWCKSYTAPNKIESVNCVGKLTTPCGAERTRIQYLMEINADNTKPPRKHNWVTCETILIFRYVGMDLLPTKRRNQNFFLSWISQSSSVSTCQREHVICVHMVVSPMRRGLGSINSFVLHGKHLHQWKNAESSTYWAHHFRYKGISADFNRWFKFWTCFMYYASTTTTDLLSKGLQICKAWPLTSLIWFIITIFQCFAVKWIRWATSLRAIPGSSLLHYFVSCHSQTNA